MQHGQFIVDRWMVGIIRAISQLHGITCVSYSDDWVLELKKDSRFGQIFGYKFSLNNAASTAIAGDKVATYQLLKAHDIPAVEHRLIRTKATQNTDWDKGLGQVVIKPLDGTSGHAVRLLHSSDEAPEYIAKNPAIAAWTIAPYEEIQTERRFILLDGKILCQYEKKPVLINDLLMFNLGLGAKAVLTDYAPEESNLAIRALQAIGLRLAAVDVVLTASGYNVLEINDGIMMENYMRQSEANKNIATQVYDQIICTMLAI